MKKLVVFCGLPGCGKSTLIREVLQSKKDYKYFDVFDFIGKYKTKEHRVPKEMSTKAYFELFEELGKFQANAILEVGVNHKEFVFEQLKKLKEKFDILIYFCLLDQMHCLKRVKIRGKLNPGRKINIKSMLSKFEMGFPEAHIAMAEKAGIRYKILKMDNVESLHLFLS